MARHRTHSLEFKRQVAHDYVAGETLHSLAKRHDLSRNLIRIWVQKYETGAFDEDAIAADLVEAYEARIAALERLVGKQALELEFLTRISQTKTCIGALDRRQLFCDKALRQSRGVPDADRV